jgi:hypothetical protein
VLGQLVQAVAHRPADLEQPRELQLGLRLHAERPHHGHVGGALSRVVEQGGLADARLAADREASALAHAGQLEQLVEASALALTADQHRSTVTH